ncbi:MAG: hypothetical protein WC644_06880 [Ignavibacteria bacterium]
MENNNNINRFIDKSFEGALLEKTGTNFTENLMKEIELTKVFKKEDKRTFGYLNILIISIAGAVITSGIALLVLLGSGASENGEREGVFSVLTSMFDNINQRLYSLIGISFTENILLYFGGIVAAIILFTFLEKAVLKRGYN